LEGIEATTRIIIIIIIIFIINNWEIRVTKLPRFNPNHSKEKIGFKLLKSQVTYGELKGVVKVTASNVALANEQSIKFTSIFSPAMSKGVSVGR
jgi:hypothetical protein